MNSTGRKRKALILGVACLAGLVATGAGRVTEQLLERPRKAFQVRQEIRNWNKDIVAGVEVNTRQAWNELAEADPLLVLKVCCVPLRAHHDGTL